MKEDEMDRFLAIFLPLFFIAYLGVAFLWRSWVVYRRTGVNPYVLGGSDSAHDYIGRTMKLTIIGVLVAVGFFSFWPVGYDYLGPIRWLEGVWVAVAGVVMLLVSFLWTALAQAQMGDSWRIGIDHERETGLIEGGVFAFSRNPIFLGMRVSMLGLFLCLPNALTFAAFVLSEVLLQVQVRLEEEHLTRLHGQAYRAYQGRVRRWL
jgi:protein-S-isoprenylcysteine O-methyltransferase Ste14